MEQLNAEQKECIDLFYYQDKSYKEIAEQKKAQEAEEKLQKDDKMGLQLMQLVGHYRDRRQERSKKVLKDAMAGLTNLCHSPAIGA